MKFQTGDKVLKLEIIAGEFSVARLAATAAIPEWATSAELFSISRTPNELSIVCASDRIPSENKAEHGWSCMRVVGPLDFALTGVLAALAGPLADSEISIFAFSTFDTDYLLVKQRTLEAAKSALRHAGHSFLGEH